LHSNRDCEKLALEAGRVVAGRVDCSLRIDSRVWDGDHECAANVSADGGLSLSAARLEQLLQDLTSWLTSPKVGTAAFAGEYSLAAEEYSKLELIFGDRPDTISSIDKPVVTIVFAIGRLGGQFGFVTDQSCLRLFAADLRKVVLDIAL
jgi:hypothetical protein